MVTRYLRTGHRWCQRPNAIDLDRKWRSRPAAGRLSICRQEMVLGDRSPA